MKPHPQNIPAAAELARLRAWLARTDEAVLPVDPAVFRLHRRAEQRCDCRQAIAKLWIAQNETITH